jgi:regulator of protease activity HflC (stomatin/prohibitin superfamily)
MQSLIKVGIAFITAVCLIVLLSPIAVINAGERGVVTHFGAVDPSPLSEGIHFRMPIRDRIVRLDVKVQKHEVGAKGSTKDLQDISAVFAVNFALQADQTPRTYQQQGSLDQIVERIVAPQTQESFKTALAQFTAEESIVKRPELKAIFDSILESRLQKYGVQVYDTSVVDIQFSPEFANAVEAKQVADQDAQRSVYIAQKAEQEAQARINQAKGEAEAQKLLQVSLDEKVLKKQELDNQSLAIGKWDGHLPNVNSGVMPFLNISEAK